MKFAEAANAWVSEPEILGLYTNIMGTKKLIATAARIIDQPFMA